jgi:glycogen phosphorylase
VGTETHDGLHFFRVQVFLGGLNLDELRVELYTNPVQGGGSAVEAMIMGKPGVDSQGGRIYAAQVSAARPASDYTPRIIPYHANASVPLEVDQILWQH